MLHRAVQSPLLQLAKSISLFSKKYLPIKAGLVPPKHAPGKVQRSKAALLLWHLDHPNFAWTPAQLMFPTQEAPTGHSAHVQSFGWLELSLRYWNSLQSDSFLYPLSWHKLNPLVYLFFGGFVLALALEKTALHYRIALWILNKTGTQDHGLLAGFMISTGFMSMWISNTATSIMMLPIATSVLAVLPKQKSESLSRPILLSIAWSANIGGMATLIGTPPNLIFAGFLSERLDREIGFIEWLPIGLTATVVLGLTAFFLLRRGLSDSELNEDQERQTSIWLKEEWAKLGPLNIEQKKVGIIFVSTAVLWIVRPYLGQVFTEINWTDTGISLMAALLLFSVGTGSKKALLDWSDTTKLPWGILLLFGGGLALAGTLQDSTWFYQLSTWLQGFGETSLLFWLIVMAILGVFATELLSNMALVSALLPLVLTISIAFGFSMELLTIPLVLGASCAFMLPMATPPNAIVFSTGKLTIPYMVSRGIVMNVISVVVLVLLGYVMSLMA